MTFSDKAIVDYVKKNFVAVWESVAPTKVTTWDLGGGKKFTGVNNGEIAIYVCRPDGKVIDILPGLRSPQETLDFLVDAEKLYEKVGSDDAALRREHLEQWRLTAPQNRPNEGTAVPLLEGTIPATSAIRGLARKSIGVSTTERLLVVQPKTPGEMRRQVRTHLQANVVSTPEFWKRIIFPRLLREPLTGGRATFPAASVRVR